MNEETGGNEEEPQSFDRELKLPQAECIVTTVQILLSSVTDLLCKFINQLFQ